MSLAVTFALPGATLRSRRRVAIGVAVSLALHALFILAYRHANLLAPPIAPAEPTAIAVTILPPPPPEPVVQATPPARSIAPATPRARKAAPPRDVIAVPDSPSAPPDPFVVQQAPQPAPEAVEQAAPAFDMDAARRIARENAHLRDPAKEGTALAQFPEPPLQTESKLARAIGAARRPDCKDGIPGGLLAPVYLLMQKKDSGCKW